MPGVLRFMVSQRVGHDSATELNWTEHGIWASQGVLVVKNPPAYSGDVRDTGSSLGWEDPLEEGMAICCSILAWRFPWTEEPGVLQFIQFSKSWTQLKWLSRQGYMPFLFISLLVKAGSYAVITYCTIKLPWDLVLISLLKMEVGTAVQVQ